MSTDLSRRGFLAGLVGLVVVGAGTGGAWHLRRRRREHERLAVLELVRRHDVELPDELGRLYLEAFPEEAEPARLFDSIFTDADELEPGALESVLAERIGRDWTELETVQIDGWILSRTEARFLALAALLS